MKMLVILSLVSSAFNARAESFIRSVSVAGTCMKTVAADRGEMTITADVTDMDLRKATKRATESYEALKAEVKKLQLKDAELSTSEYSVNEVREWEKEKSVFKGFRARMGLHVSTSDIARLGEVISVASKQGIRDVGSLTSYVSPEKTKIEYENCLESAVQDALSKAQKLAKASGSRVGKTLAIAETGVEVPRPPRPLVFAEKTMAAAADMASNATVEGNVSRINVTVNVSYQLD